MSSNDISKDHSDMINEPTEESEAVFQKELFRLRSEIAQLQREYMQKYGAPKHKSETKVKDLTQKSEA